MTPTPEQSAVLDAVASGSANIIVNSLAGTGKTTMLAQIAQTLREPTLCLAFNKRAAEEMERRVEDDGSPSFPRDRCVVRTLNAFGHRVWASTIGPKVTLNRKKTGDLFKAVVDALPKKYQKEAWNEYTVVTSGVGLGKALGYVPPGQHYSAKGLSTRESFHSALEEAPSDLASDLLDAVLNASIRSAYAGSIDFDDQIYMPALFGGSFPRFPNVLIDEAQDLSPTNHAMLDKLARGRLIAVGDPWQSIYAFRGAKTQGMQELKEHFTCDEFTQSLSFRCPERVVAHAHWRVPHLRAVKKGGHVEHLLGMSLQAFPPHSTILCRNNAPLFRLAFQLLSAGRGVNVLGSDIGPKVLRIMSKLGPDSLSREAILGAVDDWYNEKLSKAQGSAQGIADTAECMRVFATYGDSLGQAIKYAEHLFAQQGEINLLTGHKAKGGEWPIVYVLDRWLLAEHEQDKNLSYVMTTRSEDKLFEVNSKDIKA